MERKPSDVHLVSCPFDFVSAGRYVLVFLESIFMWICASVGRVRVFFVLFWVFLPVPTQIVLTSLCRVDLLRGESLWLSEAFHVGGS